MPPRTLPSDMDKKVRERRQSINRERGRRRVAIIVACLAIAVAAGLFLWLRSSDVFAVERVTADAVAHVSQEQIDAATANVQGESLLALSVDPIEEELAALPYVRSARVLRRFPNTLYVRIVEHEPAARVKASDGSVWLVSEDGRVLEKKAGGGLPLFVPASELDLEPGAYLPPMVAAALPIGLLLEETDTAQSLPALHHVSIALTGEVVMHLARGAELRLGEPTELKRKLMVASVMFQQYLRDGKRINYVDASVPDRVAVNAE
jgi:cell division septal protein FtsQ